MIVVPDGYRDFDNNILSVGIHASMDSDVNNLNFTWEITAMTNLEMSI